VPVTMSIGRTRVVFLAAVLVVTGAASLRTAGARPAQTSPSVACQLIALSPPFVSDRTMFCVGRIPDLATRTNSTLFWVSRDAGATWSRATAEGLVTSQTSVPEQLVASPLYETDQTLFLHTDEGIWKTPDFGETFMLVDGIANPGEGRLAPFVETVGGERAVFAYTQTTSSRRSSIRRSMCRSSARSSRRLGSSCPMVFPKAGTVSLSPDVPARTPQ
jgi:hypothetical protein